VTWARSTQTRVSLWVDQESQQPVRIDDARAQYRFGSQEGRRHPLPSLDRRARRQRPELAHRREVRDARPMTSPSPCAILGPPTGAS
jgi:hypothetical protein